MTKAYQDPEKLAWALHTSDNYAEAAEKLDCSTGSISVWKKKLADELEEYSPDEFSEQGPQTDQISPEGVRETILALPLDLEENDALVRAAHYGLAIELEGRVERVAGKDLNPFIALSEHRITQEYIDKAAEYDVGVIKVTEDGIEVVRDATVTNGSGMKAILTPDDADTVAKYRSRYWIKEQLNQGRGIPELAEECSVLPRTIRNQIEKFGID